MRVALITTGVTEFVGLPDALRSRFPDHQFYSVEYRPGEPFPGFTSNRLPAPSAPDVPTPLDELVQQLAAEVTPGRHRDRADFAVLIDDLELCNLDQPEVAVDAVRAAVRSHVAGLPELDPHYRERVRLALRERASFHLAVPMVEAWMFADAATLPIAGVPADRRPPRLRAGRDLETAFETDDADYAADDGSYCEQATRRGRSRRRRPKGPAWLIEARAQHPKAYLSWLCRDGEAKRCTTYQESDGGVRALAALGWGAVLRHKRRMTYARSLIADVADALDEEVPESCRGDEAPLTARHVRPDQPVLRNL